MEVQTSRVLQPIRTRDPWGSFLLDPDGNHSFKLKRFRCDCLEPRSILLQSDAAATGIFATFLPGGTLFVSGLLEIDNRGERVRRFQIAGQEFVDLQPDFLCRLRVDPVEAVPARDILEDLVLELLPSRL